MTRVASLFNKIYVLESVKESDLKTGSHLYDGILFSKKMEHENLDCELIHVRNAEDFVNNLDRIAAESENRGIFPIIHIDAHGNKSGLQLASGEFVEWNVLRGFLTRINVSCKNNLLVVLAVCMGAYLLKMVKVTSKAPFFALIGPVKEVGAGDVEESFCAFYKEFLTSFDGNAALEKLNYTLPHQGWRYAFFDCVSLYKKAFRKYYESYCKGKGARLRIESLVTKALEKSEMREIPLTEIRRHIKFEIRQDQEKYFENFKREFFMFDLYPQNMKRFDLTFNEVIK